MIRSAQVKVDDKAVAVLAAGDADGQRVVIRNTGEDPVFLGDSAVTTAGYQFAKTDPPVELELGPGEALGARCAEGKKATVHVLRTSAR